MTDQFGYGMIGLGTMGSNLVMNMSDHGFSVAGYDKDMDKVDQLNNLAKGKDVEAFGNIEKFVSALAAPRIILLLVPAGPIVDAVLFELKPLLQKGDLVMDCGNSFYVDTQERTERLLKDDLHFMGVGISGGETGARFGPSIMPGGDENEYNRVAPMLEAIAAKVKDSPCVAYMGKGSAGHYVKMVHNGIEYAIMQLLAETYHLLKEHGGLQDDELHTVFKKWNEGRLQSFLMEITAAIFLQEDEFTDNRLINMIADTAHQKGTGAWTSRDAMDLQHPIPVIDAAVSQRAMSALREQRIKAAAMQAHGTTQITKDKTGFINDLEDALYFASLVAYSQGLSLLYAASRFHQYNTRLATVASIWREGCIIRAAALEDIRQSFADQPDLHNLLLTPHFSGLLTPLKAAMKNILVAGIMNDIPLPAFSATLAYYESFHSSWLPANLVQAQRDYFGAHTYERLDKPGNFHTSWNQTIQ